MARQSSSLLIDGLEDFYGQHREPDYIKFKCLALAVLLQAKQDAVYEARGSKPIYLRGSTGTQIAAPRGSEWVNMACCADWCRVADVSVTAYRNAVMKACSEANGA